MRATCPIQFSQWNGFGRHHTPPGRRLDGASSTQRHPAGLDISMVAVTCLHDRDDKFCREFRETLAAGGMKCLCSAITATGPAFARTELLAAPFEFLPLDTSARLMTRTPPSVVFPRRSMVNVLGSRLTRKRGFPAALLGTESRNACRTPSNGVTILGKSFSGACGGT